MPLYEYECAAHGRFDEFRPFSASAEPAPCPDCGRAAPRAFSLPRLAQLAGGTRRAHEINERSAHQPHVCHAGCAHGHQRKVVPVGVDGTPKAQAYDGPRPWVIEHPR